MKPLVFTIAIVIVCTLNSFCKAGSSSDGEKAGDTFINAIDIARKAWGDCSTKERAAEAIIALEALRLKPQDAGYATCEYLKCRLFILASSNEKAKEGFIQLLGFRSVAPEAILGLLELKNGDRQKRIALEDCLSQLLPMSVWRCQSDGRKTEMPVDIEPPPPIIPKLDRKVFISIAEKYAQGGFVEPAWKAYIEAIYGGLAPGWINDPPRERGWFSSDSAELWAQAARNAWDADEHQLAYDYLAKSVIFGPEDQIDKAKEILKLWKSEPNKKKHEISKEQQLKSLEEIAKLYAEMNAHPRALELIKTYRQSFDKPDELYEKYSKEWKTIVQSYSRGAKKAVLYGVAITPDVDLTTITIPFPCSQQAVESTKAKVLDILKETSTSSTKDSATSPVKAND